LNILLLLVVVVVVAAMLDTVAPEAAVLGDI